VLRLACLAIPTLLFAFPCASQNQKIHVTGNNNTIVQVVVELYRGDENWLTENRARVEAIAYDLGVTEAMVYDFLRTIEGRGVPRDEWASILNRNAENYRTLRQKAQRLIDLDADRSRVLQLALAEISSARWENAADLIEQAVKALSSSEGNTLLKFSELYELRARTLIGDQKSVEGAQAFYEAAIFAEPESKAHHVKYLLQAAETLLGDCLKDGSEDDAKAALQLIDRHLLEKISRNQDRDQWEKIQLQRAHSLYCWGIASSDVKPLNEARQTYLEVMASAEDAKDSNFIRIELAGVLLAIAGEAHQVSAYREAVAEYDVAIAKLDYRSNREQWSRIQNNKGRALLELAELESDSTAAQEAAMAFSASLSALTRDEDPWGWALTQVNLGRAIINLAEGGDAIKSIRSGLDHYRLALASTPRARFPATWARTMLHFANAEVKLARLRNDLSQLDSALQYLNEGVAEATLDKRPVLWVNFQRNFAYVHETRGDIEQRRDGYDAALSYLRATLRQLSPSDDRSAWLDVAWNIARVEKKRAMLLNDTAYFHLTLEAYYQTLLVVDRENMPAVWADIHYRIGELILRMPATTHGAQDWDYAVHHLNLALTQVNRGTAQSVWAATNYNLGIALSAIAARDKSFPKYVEAAQAYASAAEFYKEDTAEGAFARSAAKNLASKAMQQIIGFQ
jgi:hypothetical protein